MHIIPWAAPRRAGGSRQRSGLLLSDRDSSITGTEIVGGNVSDLLISTQLRAESGLAGGSHPAKRTMTSMLLDLLRCTLGASVKIIGTPIFRFFGVSPRFRRPDHEGLPTPPVSR